MLSMVVAVPAAAVGLVVVVDIDEPIAGETADWFIAFHNNSVLKAGEDHIDIYFPVGSNITGAALNAGIIATALEGVPAMVVEDDKGDVRLVGADIEEIGWNTLRFYNLTDDIFKCEWVYVGLEGIVNPKSCHHHIQVGTSTHTPVASGDFPIYTLKMELVEGKNLISLPSYPEDTAIEVVLADLFAEAAADEDFEFSVWYWDAWEQDWVVYASDTSFDDLANMEAGRAYWVKVSDAIDFYFKGEPYPECQGPPIKQCYPISWNMIGPAWDEPIAASEYLKNAMLPWPHQNTYAVSVIFGFNEAAQVFYDTGWDPGQKDEKPWAEGDIDLIPGDGYFMSFIGEACIIPPVPGP